MNKTIVKKDLNNRTITVEHECNALREKVWEAWTDPAKLEKWWGPKTWPATSKSMDFREGGHWHYYMTGPDGTKAWGWVDYETIDPPNGFTAWDSFCDENGNKNPEFASTHWQVEFRENGEKTKIIVILTFATQADMEKIIEMGFEEGFIDALDNLDQLLA